MQATIKFSNDTSLVYVLKDTPVVRSWVHILSKASASEPNTIAKQYNSHHGFATTEQITDGIAALKQIAEKHHLPVSETITADNWHSLLNRAHVAFPNWRYRTDDDRLDAHTYNLLIHWLEYEFANLYEHFDEYLINVDFNHEPQSYGRLLKNFEVADYAEFTPVLEFGNIHLHYAHIGRHFLELANAQDFIAPPNQFVPQTRYCGTFGMVFSEPNRRNYDALRQYYDRRGGKQYFSKEYDDPTIAKGFYKLGQLSDVDNYSTIEAREELRSRISTATVTGWTFSE